VAFVCPPLDGPRTGGTLYNAELVRALATSGVSVSAVDLALVREGRAPRASRRWVDSLYLEQLPELRDRVGPGLGLLTHYLPSLVALGRPPLRDELSRHERAALDVADCFLATSAFMRDVLIGTGVSASRVGVIEPGLAPDFRGEPTASRPVGGTSFAALLVANLLPGKGVAPFLAALDGDAPIRLSIAGSALLDEGYARQCRALADGNPRVQFLGELPPSEVAELMRQSDVLVSASRMESYGMVLAEARAVGLPILARRGGNAAALVGPESGGELFDDETALARGLVALARAPEERARRAVRALASRLGRTWDDAASEFIACDDSISFTLS
jgi:glycosyltransferase involved in cell wall biosynthesis